jgi:hypothetical protein
MGRSSGLVPRIRLGIVKLESATMGLPEFETQGSLFESIGSIAPQLFDHQDRYKLFALKIWPLLSGCREELAQCYDQDNGRP